jgi:pimeloyl-ACP methyl ester carboxylesterase
MNIVEDNLNCQLRPTTLIVLLPGAYDTPKDFKEQGFVKAVRDRGLHADIRLVDAHIGYYNNQQIVQRLQDEIVTPARAKGYSQIWFAGISLGGYGTLLYSMARPDGINGFFIMAPYMGPRNIASEIGRQGGLSKWSSSERDNTDTNMWSWLKTYVMASNQLPIAYLGYGASDRFEQANKLFAQILPSERSFVIPGGHDWATWRSLWNSFLDVAPISKLDAQLHSCQSRG